MALVVEHEAAIHLVFGDSLADPQRPTLRKDPLKSGAK